MNQRTTDKGKGIAEEAAADGSSYENDDDAALEEARRRSPLENYLVEGEPSKVGATNAATTITTEPATTKVHEKNVLKGSWWIMSHLLKMLMFPAIHY